MNGEMGKRILAAVFTIFVSLAIRSNCTALPVDLGAAGPEYWSVLETGAGTVGQSQSASRGGKHATSSGSHGGVLGNIGAGQDARLSDSGAQALTNYSFNGGGDAVQPMLSQAGLDAIAASTAAAGLSATSTLNQINLKGKSLTLSAGTYDLTRLQMNRGTLTLSGPGSFVFNISSVFALKSAEVLLAGGATEANVLFNYTGRGDVGLSGSKRGNASVLHGIILALNAKVNLAAGLVVGEIISGQDISLSSGAYVQGLRNAPTQVPENSSTAALCCLACGALLLFRSVVLRCPSAPRALRAFPRRVR